MQRISREGSVTGYSITIAYVQIVSKKGATDKNDWKNEEEEASCSLRRRYKSMKIG